MLKQQIVLLWRLLGFVLVQLVNGQQPSVDPNSSVSILVHKDEQVHHSLHKPYISNGMSIPYWTFNGDTTVSATEVRLTPDLPSKKGQLWNQIPNKSKYWEVEIAFRVHGKGIGSFGDGFAFWYTKDIAAPGDVFGYKDDFVGLGIIFDTYTNNAEAIPTRRTPYVSGFLYDGSQFYNHDKDGSDTEMGGCRNYFRDQNEFGGQTRKARISFFYKKVKLEMATINNDNTVSDDYELCFEEDDVHLPIGYYFGFTAMTGGLSDNHDIIDVTTRNIKVDPSTPLPGEDNDESHLRDIHPQADRLKDVMEKARYAQNVKKDHHNERMYSQNSNKNLDGVSWGWIILCAFFVLIAGFVILVSYRMKQKSRSLKRF